MYIGKQKYLATSSTTILSMAAEDKANAFFPSDELLFHINALQNTVAQSCRLGPTLVVHITKLRTTSKHKQSRFKSRENKWGTRE